MCRIVREVWVGLDLCPRGGGVTLGCAITCPAVVPPACPPADGKSIVSLLSRASLAVSVRVRSRSIVCFVCVFVFSSVFSVPFAKLSVNFSFFFSFLLKNGRPAPFMALKRVLTQKFT